MMILSLFLVFVAAALIGGQINRGIYRLAFDQRAIGPWSAADEKAPPRIWYDRIPIFGWYALRREASIHGGGFWLRPMMIELAIAIGFSVLYWAELSGWLLPVQFANGAPGLKTILHSQFLAHVILISLMAMATFIDFDEQTIPDSITVPGTLIGLLLLWALPSCALIVADFGGRGMPAALGFMHLASPNLLPGWVDGPNGLGLALAIFVLWCFGLLDRRWIMRSGLQRAIALFLHGLFRNSAWIKIAVIAAVGSVAITAAWLNGGANWGSLLTSLCGLAGGAGTVWAIRIVGTLALKKEAMGFGDVTLMGMVGAFIGWQAATLAFFLAPFAGVIVALFQLIVIRETRIAYGPYLCVASLGLVLTWGRLWPEWAEGIYALGPFLGAIFFSLLALMFILLLGMRLLRWLVGV
jgi:prepilin signal peptidase PulO-like enzyme (type II secretory pathway)